MTVKSPCDGVCKGGPWDGQRYRHWSDSFPLMKPAATGAGLFLEPLSATIEAVEFGRYHYDGYGGWTWIPATKS